MQKLPADALDALHPLQTHNPILILAFVLGHVNDCILKGRNTVVTPRSTTVAADYLYFVCRPAIRYVSAMQDKQYLKTETALLTSIHIIAALLNERSAH